MPEGTRPESFEFSGYRLNRRLRICIDRTGDQVHLTGKTFDALLCFLERPGEPIARDTLMAALWPGSVVEENNLTQTIATLRRTFGSEIILTIPRRGYQFTANVRPAVGDVFADTVAPAEDPLRRLVSRPRLLALTASLAIFAFVATGTYILFGRTDDSAAASRSAGPLPAPESSDTGSGAGPSGLAALPTRSPEAYAAYQDAMQLFSERGYTSETGAYDLLSEAITADDEFMPAYLQRGIAAFLRSRNAVNPLVTAHPDPDLAERLLEAARKDSVRALELDPNSGYAHALAGGIRLLMGDTRRADEHFDEAMILGRDDPDVIVWVAGAHFGEGRRGEALVLVDRLVAEVFRLRYEPFTELLALAGYHESSAAVTERYLRDNPTDSRLLLFTGLGAAILGEHDRALQVLSLAEDRADLETPRRYLVNNLAKLTYAYGRIGQTERALEVYEMFERAVDAAGSANPAFHALNGLEACLGIGDRNCALGQARIIAESHRPAFMTPQLHFMYNSYADPILDEPEFMELRRSMGYRG